MRKDSETFKTLALQHGRLCCCVSICALFTAVLAVGPAVVSFTIAGVQVGLHAKESPCSQEGWAERCGQKFLFKGAKNTQWQFYWFEKLCLSRSWCKALHPSWTLFGLLSI